MSAPDWMGAYVAGHYFRAISAAVGDRHRRLGAWRIFGYIGEHSHNGRSTHGPWRPTADAAMRAVYRRSYKR